jgi:uncharacterized RDD family membrane protein YckC
MSIMPLPELPPQADGVRLSVLDAYTGQPGSPLGVGFWPRVAARVIDFIVHYFVALCSGLLLGLLVAIAARLQHRPMSAFFGRHPPNSIAVFGLALLGSIVLEAICEGFHGSTPGKRLLGFTVVQEDGSPCRPGSAFIRSFAYVVDSLFFGLIGYFNMQKTPQQQRHGDEWARTVVCRRSDVAPENLRGAGQFVAAFLFAAMADAALMITGQLLRIIA